MRNAFADEITRLGSSDPRVVLLSGDIGNKLFDKFKAANGTRFLNCGIAEANMMGVAAGMALSGQPASASSPEAWKQFRAEVESACVAMAAPRMKVASIRVA